MHIKLWQHGNLLNLILLTEKTVNGIGLFLQKELWMMEMIKQDSGNVRTTIAVCVWS